MTRLRRVRGPIAAAWLLCQAVPVAIVPVVFWFDAAAAERGECTCAHGDHAMCPMHHSTSRPGMCVLGDVDNDGVALLTSLLGQLGLVPTSAHAFLAGTSPVPALTDTAGPSLRPTPPDPPPLRA